MPIISRPEHGSKGQELETLIQLYRAEKERTILWTAICCLCVWCSDQTKNEVWEGHGTQLNIYQAALRFQPSVLATQTWISKCQLPSVKSVQLASNQSPHSKANVMWQLSTPCSMSPRDILPGKHSTVYCSQLSVKKWEHVHEDSLCTVNTQTEMFFGLMINF